MKDFKRSKKYVKSKKKPNSYASYPALPITQNKQKFYIVTIPVEDIFPFCFVARRDDDPIEGFQRLLSESRAIDIASYLDNSKGSIPTNIVLSAQDVAEVSYNSKSKTIKYRRTNKSFLVLDGQHRLYGYGQTTKKHRVPVAIYEGLNRNEEVNLFIDINTNQKGVPAALLLDIKKFAERESKKEQELRDIFDKLNTDANSPFNGLLSPSRSVSGKISRVTFNRAMDQVLDNIVTSQLSEDIRYKLILNYFRALEYALSSTDLMRKSSYFEAFCSLFSEAIRISSTIYGNYKYDSLCSVLAPIQKVNFSQLTTGGTTRLTKTQILPMLKQVLTQYVKVNEDMV